VTSALALEDFTRDLPGEPRTEPAPAPVNEDALRMEGYDRGYQAGWDDAIRSAHDEQEHIDAELGRNLEELSFTFEEAQNQVCLSLEHLVRTLLDQVLPHLYTEHFPAILEETIVPIIEEAGDITAELICAPDDLDQVQRLTARHQDLPMTLRAEPSFARHQVRLQLGYERHDINGDQLLSDMRTAVDSFFSQLQDQTKNVS